MTGCCGTAGVTVEVGWSPSHPAGLEDQGKSMCSLSFDLLICTVGVVTVGCRADARVKVSKEGGMFICVPDTP